ncbi:hypothetical protein ABFP60_08060 [Clostridioides difficile]
MSCNRCNCPSCNNHPNTWVVPVSYCNESSNATFWQSNTITVPGNSAIPFNIIEEKTSDITLTNQSTINLLTSGVYQINYTANAFINYSYIGSTTPPQTQDLFFGLYVNGVQKPVTNTRFYANLTINNDATADEYSSYSIQYSAPITATFNIRITAPTNIQLVNLNNYTVTFVNGNLIQVPSVTINIQRLGSL